MRIVGIVLAVFGSLALAFQTFAHVGREKGENQNAVREERRVWLPPAVSGIVLVTGLILMVLANKKDTG